MPRIRPGMKKPPPGFDLISEKLDEFEELMKDAVQTPSLGVLSTSSQSQSQNAKRLRGESSSKSQIEETADDHEGGREERNDDELVPPLWRVAAINRERTRYVYDACFREKKITRELYDYCCEMQFIDGGLARRWQLSGYERLCCTACGVPGAASVAASMTTKLALRDKAGKKRGRNDDGHAETESTCICRVPASQRRTKHFTACTVCGCSGCCSSDV